MEEGPEGCGKGEGRLGDAGQRRPLAVEPTEQHCDRSGIVPEMVPGTLHDPEIGGTMCVGDCSGIENRHRIVVAPVHDEQFTW